MERVFLFTSQKRLDASCSEVMNFIIRHLRCYCHYPSSFVFAIIELYFQSVTITLPAYYVSCKLMGYYDAQTVFNHDK